MYSLISFAKCVQSCNYIHKVQDSNHSRKFLQVNSYPLPALEISDLFSVLTILSLPGCLINRINLGSLIQHSTLQTNSCFCMYHQFVPFYDEQQQYSFVQMYHNRFTCSPVEGYLVISRFWRLPIKATINFLMWFLCEHSSFTLGVNIQAGRLLSHTLSVRSALIETATVFQNSCHIIVFSVEMYHSQLLSSLTLDVISFLDFSH